ncbi:TlpA family protein disulfide reductase [Mesorhizobium sp. Cs1299R1N3]|uniref:TlpA family protein disulfide reductase n=1 Tax=Mesorhizobium sp. Cs1299R1N3 TaxID=3015173 RepID=UPI00301DF6A1
MPHFSRRSLLRATASIATGLVMPALGTAKAAAGSTFDNPPLFETARHQFQLFQPAALMPVIQLSGIDHRPIDLAPSPGKVTLVTFWATWCKACRGDLPRFDQLQAANRKGLNVVAVSVDKDRKADLASYLMSLGVRHLAIYRDPFGHSAHDTTEHGPDVPFTLYDMPITYLVTSSGKIAGFMPGSSDWMSEAGLQLLAYYARA